MSFQVSKSPAATGLMILGLAIAYMGTGILALGLAVPPGYATAVWPPAGIAVAAILLYGNRLWPGVFLGSLLTNCWQFFDAHSTVSFNTDLSMPISIGMGAVAQALVGAQLIRRFVGFPNTLTQDLDLSLIHI